VINFSGPHLCSFLHDRNVLGKGKSSSARSSKENRFPHAWSLTQLLILVFPVDAKINIENIAVFAIIHQTLKCFYTCFQLRLLSPHLTSGEKGSD